MGAVHSLDVAQCPDRKSAGGCADDGDDCCRYCGVDLAKAARFTQVHCRYQVIGFLDVEDAGELVETYAKRVDATRRAEAEVGPTRFRRTEVYDTMRPRGLDRTVASFPVAS